MRDTYKRRDHRLGLEAEVEKPSDRFRLNFNICISVKNRDISAPYFCFESKKGMAIRDGRQV